MSDAAPFTVAASFSPLTIYEIRYGHPRKGEAAHARLGRLCAMYGLMPAHVRAIAAADDDAIDLRGRRK